MMIIELFTVVNRDSISICSVSKHVPNHFIIKLSGNLSLKNILENID